MIRNTVNKYVWLVDTLRRYGRLSHERIDELWLQSSLSEGKPLPRRTFFAWRNAIEEMFGVDIVCDKTTREFYIEQQRGGDATSLHEWLVDSMALSGMLTDSRDLADRIVLEPVPSARGHLPVIIDAMKRNRCIRFAYRSYTRSVGTDGVLIEPYFVKIFKQKWYVIGMHVADQRIKTYALDRMRDLMIDQREFTMPEGFDPNRFFANYFGITTSRGEPRDIVLRVEPTQAKYLRALPLHHSQQEQLQDGCSIFRYRMCITYDLREQLLSMGPNIEVISPLELRTIMADDLRRALGLYENLS